MMPHEPSVSVTPPGIERWEVLDLLTSLVQKSLVVYEEDEGEGRYRLLETVRQYARDRLVEAGEAERLRAHHLELFLRLAEQAELESLGPGQAAWFARLEREHENLRAALAWSSECNDADLGLRLAGALGTFWEVRGYWAEGQEFLTGMLARPGAEVRNLARARALGGAAHLAFNRGETEVARAFYEESLLIFRELGEWRGAAHSLLGLGTAASDEGNDEVARQFLEESLATFRSLGDQHGIASSLLRLGWASRPSDGEAAQALYSEGLAIFRQLAHKQGIAASLHNLGKAIRAKGEFQAARTLYEESLAIFRELGAKAGMAWLLFDLGWLAFDQWDYEEARLYFEESLAIQRETGYKRGIAFSLDGLGRVAYDQSDYSVARARFGESLLSLQELGSKPDIPWKLEELAAVALAQALPERAARLFGAAESQREKIRFPMPPAARAKHERFVADVRSALGEAVFAAAWAEGCAMLLDEAVAYALSDEQAGDLDGA